MGCAMRPAQESARNRLIAKGKSASGWGGMGTRAWKTGGRKDGKKGREPGCFLNEIDLGEVADHEHLFHC